MSSKGTVKFSTWLSVDIDLPFIIQSNGKLEHNMYFYAVQYLWLSCSVYCLDAFDPLILQDKLFNEATKLRSMDSYNSVWVWFFYLLCTPNPSITTYCKCVSVKYI